MYCENCKKFDTEKTEKCKYCPSTKLARALGVVLSLFLGPLGLAIGLRIYPEGYEERRTFISGWIIGYFVWTAIAVISGVIALIRFL